MFSMNLEDNMYSSDDELSIIEGGSRARNQRLSYNMSSWYKYEANVLLENINEIESKFPGHKYLSAEDIIEYIAYSKHGAYILLDNLRGLQKRLREIEARIKNGKWQKRMTAGLSKLNSENIISFIDDITNVHKLEKLSDLIHEDIYMSYFVGSMSNIKLTEPKVPHFPSYPRRSVRIDNREDLKKLINEIISYLNILERYHTSITKLIIECNAGLDKILNI